MADRQKTLRELFSRLVSLLPPHPTQMSMPELLEHATVQVKQLQEHVEELKRRKMQLEGPKYRQEPRAAGEETIKSPVIEITDSGSTMEVNLVMGMGTMMALCNIITILEEEGAEVFKVTYHNDGSRILVSVHSQAAYSRIGIESSRVRERLKALQFT